MIERTVLTAIVVVAILTCLALMRWGWVRRGRRQSDVPPLLPVPDVPVALGSRDVTGTAARYVGANRSGDWLDRVVVHTLGAPSAALVTVRTAGAKAEQPAPESPVAGVWVSRQGAPDIFVPAEQVLDVRHDRAAGGSAFEAGGVLVITWRHGGGSIDLGLRVRDPAEAEGLRIAVSSLRTVRPRTGDRS